MTGALVSGVAVDALAAALPMAALPADEVRSGAPLAGYAVLGRFGSGDVAVELGVWQMTEGVATDVEVDEVFVVLAGRAAVEIEGVAEPVELRPGVVVRLDAGMRTVWTVHEPIRKLVLS